jgi:antitoxin YqcF
MTQQPSEANRWIARHARDVFAGEEARVVRYLDAAESSEIHVLQSSDTPVEGLISFCTVGLSDRPDPDGPPGLDPPLGVEILAVSGLPEFGAVVSTAAFYVINSGNRLRPGAVFRGVVGMHRPSSSARNLMFVEPCLWGDEDFASHALEGKTVAWLQALPISDAEAEFVRLHGADALTALFDDEDPDFLDLDRDSVRLPEKPAAADAAPARFAGFLPQTIEHLGDVKWIEGTTAHGLNRGFDVFYLRAPAGEVGSAVTNGLRFQTVAAAFPQELCCSLLAEQEEAAHRIVVQAAELVRDGGLGLGPDAIVAGDRPLAPGSAAVGFVCAEHPFLDEDFNVVRDQDGRIEMQIVTLIPATAAEISLARERGVPELFELWDEQETDLADLARPCAVEP